MSKGIPSLTAHKGKTLGAGAKKSKIAVSAALCAATISFTGYFEGRRLVAYLDPVGIPTICEGVTKGVKLGQVATPAQCDEMIKKELLIHEAGMLKCLSRELPDATHVAALSFTYNVGIGAFCGSTFARKLNLGDIQGACAELPKWDKATLRGKKITLPGLTKRRLAEKDLCLLGRG